MQILIVVVGFLVVIITAFFVGLFILVIIEILARMAYDAFISWILSQ